jgi:hypothetical protein
VPPWSGTINCPMCTFLNADTSVVCIMCNSPMKQ